MKDEFSVTIGDVRNGYPCPKDDARLEWIDATPERAPGAWCPECHTVWRLLDEVSLADLDAEDCGE